MEFLTVMMKSASYRKSDLEQLCTALRKTLSAYGGRTVLRKIVPQSKTANESNFHIGLLWKAFETLKHSLRGFVQVGKSVHGAHFEGSEAVLGAIL